MGGGIGIEPLYPNVDSGFLAMRWPLELHEKIIT